MLVHLEAANQFVIPLDEERCWYRYHHLFADLLRNQLTRSHPEWIPELHRRASRWYEENGDIHSAVEHALQASDLTQAAHLMEQYTLPKLYQGEVAKVVGWYDKLPKGVLESAPMLCIDKAWALVLMQRGARRGEVEQALHSADLALDRVNANEALCDLVAGHTAAIRAFLLRIPVLKDKKPEILVALAKEAQRLLPVEEKTIRSTAALNIGYGYLAQADLEAASQAFKQTPEDGLTGGNYYAAVYGPIHLIVCTLLLGQLSEALKLCETNIERFNQIQAGRYFPPIGALYIQKGSIFLEYDCLAQAEQALTEGLDLVRWTGEDAAPRRGYTALARLRAIQGDRSATMETLKTFEEIWPEGTLYIQALRYRLMMRHWPDDLDLQKDAYLWLIRFGIELDELAGIGGVNPLSTAYFECYLNAAHVLARLSKWKPGEYRVEGVLENLKHQQDFAESHGFLSWVVEIAIARALLYQVAGKKREALDTLQMALSTAAPTGLLRILADEREPLKVLLEQLKLQLTDEALIAYANLVLEVMRYGPEKPAKADKNEGLLSERELEVLRYLAKGLSYEEIGRQLFLSLNTIQFHVKNIYSKLLVNKRVQAIQKAQEMNLI